MNHHTEWRKSSYSSDTGGNCLEIAEVPGSVLVRDTPSTGSWATWTSPRRHGLLSSQTSKQDACNKDDFWPPDFGFGGHTGVISPPAVFRTIDLAILSRNSARGKQLLPSCRSYGHLDPLHGLERSKQQPLLASSKAQGLSPVFTCSSHGTASRSDQAEYRRRVLSGPGGAATSMVRSLLNPMNRPGCGQPQRFVGFRRTHARTPSRHARPIALTAFQFSPVRGAECPLRALR